MYALWKATSLWNPYGNVMTLEDLKVWERPQILTFKSDWNYFGAAAEGEIKITASIIAAPVGQFVEAYARHLKIPWWRRRRDWREVEFRMRNILDNNIIVQTHI